MAKKAPKVTLEFTPTELKTLRRCLNRAVDCCEGRCPGYQVFIWYYVQHIVQKVEDALQTIKADKKKVAEG